MVLQCVHGRQGNPWEHLPIARQDEKGVGLRGPTDSRRDPDCRLLSVAAVGGGFLIYRLDAQEEAGRAVGQPRLETSPSPLAAEGHGRVERDVSAKDRRENARRIPRAGCLLLRDSNALRRIRRQIRRRRSVASRRRLRRRRIRLRRRLLLLRRRRRPQICRVFQVRWCDPRRVSCNWNNVSV